MGDEANLQVRDDLATLAQAVRRLAKERIADQDWSGLPLPVPGLELVLEPRYKHKSLSEFRWKECYYEDGTRHEFEEEKPREPPEFETVNS